MNLGLEDKVALVCGSSRGLGRAVADELAAEGASVAVCARDPAALERAADEIGRTTGAAVLAVPADLAVPGEPTRVVEACRERFGRLDVLVTNTGGPPAGTHDTLSLEDWDRATALLLRSTVELAAGALPEMKSRGWGRILAVTSVAAKQPVDNLMLSNSLRAAVTGFAATLAREVATDGITVNTILPGYTATERVTELNEANARREGVEPAEVQARLEAEIPLGRLAEPREFAALAAFLVSERAAYITGGAFAVDGGWLRGLC
ncbi:MAG TPA: SDR family oxidoreductase [Gaiellaceae bacterium]|nr:SDR family oxidoreductase [Gaiellaceae bacterium]